MARLPQSRSIMSVFELTARDLTHLTDADLRELVARLCEAELTQHGLSPACTIWGGAQEANDGGLDVEVRGATGLPDKGFLPRPDTGFQVKRNSMGKAACAKEMHYKGAPKKVLVDLAAAKGSYIIVSGHDDCSKKMLNERVGAMRDAVAAVPGKQDLNLDFYGTDRLATWLRQHASVMLWARLRLGRPLAGWKPHGRWAYTPPEQDDAFLADAFPSVIDVGAGAKHAIALLDGIQLARDRLRPSGSAVRLTGLSGVGKTRFAQALFEPEVADNALPASHVVYADVGDELSPSATDMLAHLIARDWGGVVVLDNCPPQLHRKLQKQSQASRAKLRLLTIEYDISDERQEETAAIHLEPTSEHTVSLLVQKRYPALDPLNADRIAEFAGGNARIALALASRVDPDETLSNFLNDDLFHRLFSQRKEHSATLLEGAQALSLVYSFNVSSTDSENELATLATICGRSRKDLYADQAELLRRQLAQQRGNWRAILPHALSNRLARRALESISPEDINAELFKPENIRLFKSCAHRLGYLHDNPAAQALARTWLQPGAPLSRIAGCTQDTLIALEFVAPVFPETVLLALENAAQTPGFASRQNAHYTRIVRLLRHLSYDDHLFDRACKIILDFAFTEQEDEKVNSIMREMQQLFSPQLSGTQATPARRQAFVAAVLDLPQPRAREIAQQLLTAAFDVYSTPIFDSFDFGARERGMGWQPTDEHTQHAWYSGFLAVLDPLLDSPNAHDRQWAKLQLARVFRNLWSWAGCHQELEARITPQLGDEDWTGVWIAIKQTLAYDKHELPAPLLARLHDLEKRTAPTEAFSQIQAYALVDSWDHVDLDSDTHQADMNAIYDKVVELGALTAVRPEYVERLGAQLWLTHAEPLFAFGQGLATGSTDLRTTFDQLIASLRKHTAVPPRPPTRTNIRVLEGFLHGAHQADPDAAKQILEHTLTLADMRPYVVSLLLSIPLTAWSLQHLNELARAGEVEAHRFERLGYGGRHQALTDSQLATLLVHVTSLPLGFASTIQLLKSRLHAKPADSDYVPNDELRNVARAAILAWVRADKAELSTIRFHGIEHVLELGLGPDAPAAEIEIIASSFCQGVETHRLYAHNLGHLTNALLQHHPEILLDTVFNTHSREQHAAYMLFRDRSNRSSPSLNNVDLSRLLAWCGADQTRLMNAVRASQPFIALKASDKTHPLHDQPKRVVLSGHVKALLDAAPDKVALAQLILDRIPPNHWSEPLSNVLEARAKAFEELIDHPDPTVQHFAKQHRPLLAQRVASERAREQEDHRRGDQRFEYE